MFIRQQPGTFGPGFPGFPGQQSGFFGRLERPRTASEQTGAGKWNALTAGWTGLKDVSESDKKTIFINNDSFSPLQALLV